MVQIMENNGSDRAASFCVKVWYHLPGLHPWGLAGVFAVGPGLFPARLRRSSACACAAAAVSRVKKTKQNTHTFYTEN